MRACQYCRYANREGFFFCEDCGQPISSEAPAESPTKQIDQSLEHYEWRTSYGTTHFQSGAMIMLHVLDHPTPIVVRPIEQVIIGRKDTDNRLPPDIDLSPYGAAEKGVSRVHAAILRTEEALVLIDKGSANGTHLNGQRLIPQQPRVLRDGDEIRLGRLVAHIYFTT